MYVVGFKQYVIKFVFEMYKSNFNCFVERDKYMRDIYF